MAADCKAAVTCGMCAGNHRTDKCEKTDPGSYRCVNCNEAGHASWDRMCPRFMDASKRAKQADPENTYKYFPTEEPWTWEQRYSSKEPAVHGEPPSQGEQ